MIGSKREWTRTRIIDTLEDEAKKRNKRLDRMVKELKATELKDMLLTREGTRLRYSQGQTLGHTIYTPLYAINWSIANQMMH